jgi:hypothetical protein
MLIIGQQVTINLPTSTRNNFRKKKKTISNADHFVCLRSVGLFFSPLRAQTSLSISHFEGGGGGGGVTKLVNRKSSLSLLHQ